MSYEVIRTNELYHHGVKGMKWGVRRYQNKDGTLTAKGVKKYATAGYKRDAKGKALPGFRGMYANSRYKLNGDNTNAKRATKEFRRRQHISSTDHMVNAVFYGKKGAQRIQNSVRNKGLTQNQAVNREAMREFGVGTAATLATSMAMATYIDLKSGRNSRIRQATNRGAKKAADFVKRRAAEKARADSVLKLAEKGSVVFEGVWREVH